MNIDQGLLVFEMCAKDNLRNWMVRKFVGFDAIHVPLNPDMSHLRAEVTIAAFVSKAGSMTLGISMSKAHKLLLEMYEAGYIIQSRSGGWKANEEQGNTWAVEVHDSLVRQGLPVTTDAASMEAARLKANEERAKRREQWSRVC